jgi:hypothetical protein
MNIILAGVMGRYPYGGVAWCSLMYLLGLQRLGHKVWYLEDTGQCNYDPVANTLCREPSYALSFLHSCLKPYGLEERWCYIDFKGKYHGHTREAWRRVCADADLFLNLSGGCWFWRDEYAAIPHSAFIDSDPAFTQTDIARRGPGHEAFFTPFSALFTFGRNIGTPLCAVPTSGLHWEHTWQPVCLDEWHTELEPSNRCFTTVMTWKIRKFSELGGNKDREFHKVLRLPSLLAQSSRLKLQDSRSQEGGLDVGDVGVEPAPLDWYLELAVNGPQELLREHGWHCLDAFSVSHSPDAYRNYIRTSLGEFSVAKHAYVQTNSGWFSDRTECYLASGRPAVVQDTGFSAHIPTGHGLFAFTTIEEALAGLQEVVASYDRHSRVARELAQAHFAAEVVLPKLLERATSKAPAG